MIDISHQIRQPQDNYNSGILALENAHDLNQMLDRQQTVGWVFTALNRDRDTNYFHHKREYFSSLLNDDMITHYVPSNVNNDEEKRKEIKAISPEDSDLSEPVRVSFFAAIKKGELTEVKKYLEQAHDQETLNDFLLAGDNDHKTALHLAAEHGNLDLVDYLIRQGSHPNVQDKKHRTPLYYASALHHAVKAGQAMVQLLTEHGANLKLETKNKSTALILAAKYHHAILIRFIIDKVINNEFYINSVDKQGMNALLYLAKEKQWELFQYVVAHGGNINQADKTGKLPITWVLEAQRFDLAQFMLEHDLDVELLSEVQKKSLLSEVIKSNLEIQSLQQNLYTALFSTLRLNNIGLIKTLFQHLGYNDPASSNLKLQIDSIIPRIYEELKLRHVPLSYQTSYYIENLILKSRFTSINTNENKKEIKTSLAEVVDRIQIITEFSHQLTHDYAIIDSEFLLKAQFIAQTIHHLKSTLRSTYHQLPWEEMEFCLVNFIHAHTQPETADFISQIVIDKERFLGHLKNFADQLAIEKIKITERSLQGDFPKQTDPKQSAHHEAQKAVIANNPLFESLYQDHEKIRTLYSLNKIEFYLKSALSIDLNADLELGKLVIERTLQVIGENLKNTLQSPNVSDEIHQFLILFAPKYLRETVTSLRDSLSHAYLLKNKITLEIEQDAHFFKKIQTDLQKIHLATTDMLYRYKVYIIKDFLKKFWLVKILMRFMPLLKIYLTFS
ncbi:ankyrin repeat domain-containing protein [Rickettsiella massiliensis]|uniref:ankyrin repeat domain-containing protein n=1 Tax=Rickettsiella massiliensis TaxID=676517 RepID=UPI00029A15D2|nr:ankyrin repeat domain-containing protein [Rickettsiella massiliensis]